MVLLRACTAPPPEPPAGDTHTKPTDNSEPSCEPGPLPVESTFMRGYTGAEDFAFLAREVPACYAWLGNGPVTGGRLLHSPHFDFNDETIPLGVRYWVTLVETLLPADAAS